MFNMLSIRNISNWQLTWLMGPQEDWITSQRTGMELTWALCTCCRCAAWSSCGSPNSESRGGLRLCCLLLGPFLPGLPYSAYIGERCLVLLQLDLPLTDIHGRPAHFWKEREREWIGGGTGRRGRKGNWLDCEEINWLINNTSISK